MSTTRIPTYSYLTTANTVGLTGMDFGFDAVRIHIEHSCAEKLWVNPNSSVATTADCCLSSGLSLDIDHCGRTPVFSWDTTTSGKIISLFAFGQ